MNEWTRASLKTARRDSTMAALRARRQWHALPYWLNDAPRRVMRAKLSAARLYRQATTR